MTITLKADAGGTTGIIMVNGADALRIDSDSHLIEAVAPFVMTGNGLFGSIQGTTTKNAVAGSNVMLDMAAAYNIPGGAGFNLTNSTFLPNVAGLYHIIAAGATQISDDVESHLTIYKNGTALPGGTVMSGKAAPAAFGNGVTSTFVHLNGVSDYVQVGITRLSGTPPLALNNFQGLLVKAY